MIKKQDVTTDKIVNIFFKYTIPTIIGMIAISSAAITDGIFVGRFIGPEALAVINLIIPFVSLMLGIIIMLGSGGCVLCGKLIGENNEKEASGVFSQIVLIIFILSLIVCFTVLNFPYKTAQILGANRDVAPNVVLYIKNYLYFLPLQLLGLGISFFARVNGKPGLTSFALLFSAVMNVVLDWILIIYFKMGISGAALATGISQSMTFFILLPSFFSSKSNLKFIIPNKFRKETFFSIINGLSEFLNESSSGIVVFVFNHVLMMQSGIDGVAAFTIVNYFLYSGCLIAYSVVASIHGPVSINFGAGLIERTREFLKAAVWFNLILGIILAL
ncbi:MAG: MATE family efflux transporter, partial [Desulfobacteraceae bacterium]